MGSLQIKLPLSLEDIYFNESRSEYRIKCPDNKDYPPYSAKAYPDNKQQERFSKLDTDLKLEVLRAAVGEIYEMLTWTVSHTDIRVLKDRMNNGFPV